MLAYGVIDVPPTYNFPNGSPVSAERLAGRPATIVLTDGRSHRRKASLSKRLLDGRVAKIIRTLLHGPHVNCVFITFFGRSVIWLPTTRSFDKRIKPSVNPTTKYYYAIVRLFFTNLTNNFRIAFRRSRCHPRCLHAFLLLYTSLSYLINGYWRLLQIKPLPPPS